LKRDRDRLKQQAELLHRQLEAPELKENR